METKLDRIIKRRDRAYNRWHMTLGRAAFDWLMIWDAALFAGSKNMSKHTPGPFERIGICIMSATPGWTGRTLAKLFDVDTKAELEANGDLFAAAPDLLEACESAIDCLAPHMDMVRDELEAAIARAKGE